MKNWYESKSLWAAFGLIGMAVFRYYEAGDWDGAMVLVFNALAILGIRTGHQKIK